MNTNPFFKGFVKWLQFALLGLSISFIPALASAHTGGPPFAVVNGEYAQTSPIYGAAPDKIPQDELKSQYVVGQPVEFKIDTNALGFAADGRWFWTRDSTSYTEGDSVKHTYDKPGSYWVALQLRGEPTSGQWADYDSIKVDVVPRAGYIMPKVQVTVAVKEKSGQHDATLRAYPSRSSSPITHYSWSLGDGQTASTQTTHHTYPTGLLRSFPILIVTDANGLQTDTALQLDDSTGPLKASSLDFLPGVVVPARSPVNNLWLAIGAGFVVVTIGAVVMLRRRHTKPV